MKDEEEKRRVHVHIIQISQPLRKCCADDYDDGHISGDGVIVSTLFLAFLCSVAFPQVNEETKLFPVFYFFGPTKAPYLNSKVKHQLINYKK